MFEASIISSIYRENNHIRIKTAREWIRVQLTMQGSIKVAEFVIEPDPGFECWSFWRRISVLMTYIDVRNNEEITMRC